MGLFLFLKQRSYLKLHQLWNLTYNKESSSHEKCLQVRIDSRRKLYPEYVRISKRFLKNVASTLGNPPTFIDTIRSIYLKNMRICLRFINQNQQIVDISYRKRSFPATARHLENRLFDYEYNSIFFVFYVQLRKALGLLFNRTNHMPRRRKDCHFLESICQFHIDLFICII